jgi:hypothetical protein
MSARRVRHRSPDLRAGGANLHQETVGPEVPFTLNVRRAVPSRQELALIRKTLKANPGCSIVGAGGSFLYSGAARNRALARFLPPIAC